MLQAEWEDEDNSGTLGARDLGRLRDLLLTLRVRLDNFILVSGYILLSVLDG